MVEPLRCNFSRNDRSNWSWHYSVLRPDKEANSRGNIMENCVITSAVRTAVGSYLGSLKTSPAQFLASAVIKEAVKRSNVAGTEVNHVIMGHVLPSADAPNIARVATLLAGLPEEVPAFTVDRQCGSALQAVVTATQEIQTGYADVVVAGGTENMSRAPYYLPLNARYEGFRMGDSKLYDSFIRAVEYTQPPELYQKVNMGITAENVAAKHNISRQEQDAFALHSQQKAVAAIQAGKFREEIIPFEIVQKKGVIVFDTDEFPKADTTPESLATLKPAFVKDGSVTAGNASGMNDGASAVVVMSETKAKSLGCKPLVRILAHAVTGLDPRVMGLGPVSAIQSVLVRTGLKLEDIDLFEINEAFAAQSLGVLKELGMAPGSPLYDRVNVNGGAVALGHALGSSGTRILTTLIYELGRRQGRYGIASLCIGGGQGIALLVERV
jgi:acetyl-CoA C-acetyltransferase